MRKVALAAVLLGCLTVAAARHRAAVPPAAPKPIDIRRSLVITSPALLDGFDFQRVIQKLIDSSGATTTPLTLVQQWFDTQNPKPGLAVPDAPHCDDFITNGKPSFNGFPRRCPTPEGILATSDPFTAHDYFPIGITNRFDLTPSDGSNCGQYRIIYAKNVSPSQKLHIIFEPVLPNPNPAAGVAGCRPVAQFWAGLSGIDSVAERRARLERFFFDGIDGFEPVLMASHLTIESGGRMRNAQNSPTALTRFYQFHLKKDGTRLLVVPGLLQDLAYGSLFNATANTALGPEFRQFFISQVATLAIKDVNGFYDRIPEKYLIAESHPEDSPLAFDSGGALNQGLSSTEGKAFNDALLAEIQRAGSNMTVNELMVRVDLMQCQGCHLGGPPIGDGLIFPRAFGGTHGDETQETVNNVTGFKISDGLRDVFAPNRARILSDFLSGKPLPVHSNGTTIGGGRTSD